MNKLIICIGAIAIAVCAFGLMQVKHKVKNLKRDLIETHRELAAEKEALHVLKAEWTLLTDPKRIRKLTKRYLALKPVNVAQIHKPSKIAQIEVEKLTSVKQVASQGIKVSPVIRKTSTPQKTVRASHGIRPTLRPTLASF